jgi:hypothetical protein
MITITKATSLGQSEVEDSEQLWRYMKLSTFMQLLDGAAFIPSLEQLQKGDAKENYLPANSPSPVRRTLNRNADFKAAETFLVSAMRELERRESEMGTLLAIRTS